MYSVDSGLLRCNTDSLKIVEKSIDTAGHGVYYDSIQTTEVAKMHSNYSGWRVVVTGRVLTCAEVLRIECDAIGYNLGGFSVEQIDGGF